VLPRAVLLHLQEVLLRVAPNLLFLEEEKEKRAGASSVKVHTQRRCGHEVYKLQKTYKKDVQFLSSLKSFPHPPFQLQRTWMTVLEPTCDSIFFQSRSYLLWVEVVWEEVGRGWRKRWCEPWGSVVQSDFVFWFFLDSVCAGGMGGLSLTS
jgi:hypothetical protein